MKRRGGYTLIELVLVLMLLILVASVVFTLAGAGSRTYLRMTAKQVQTGDLRIALSYLDVQIRKNDVKDAWSIRPDPFEGHPALVVEQDFEGRTCLTWIYVREGYLCELFVDESTVITDSMGSRIAPVDRMTLDVQDEGSLVVTLFRQEPDRSVISQSRAISMRAGGVRQ
ncbi:MAG: DUF4860 domain-containing protein [Saccharofermentanales bacterium]|jgi:type II secretory pathway pseudopilin PulG